MYITVFEDGQVTKVKTLEPEDFIMANDGYMNIIDISDPTSPKMYFNDKWHDIDEVIRETRDD